METTLVSPIEALVGSRVRMRRIVLALRREKLGDRIGITFQHVQKYQNGAHRAGAGWSMAILKILDIVGGFFVQEDENLVLRDIISYEPREGSPFVSSNEGTSLNRAFAQITDRVVRKKNAALAKVPAGKGSDRYADPFDVPGDLNGSKQELRT